MAGQPVPPRFVEAFAIAAGGSYITIPIPTPSQIGIVAGAASLTDGFPPLTMTELSSGGIPPFGQDVNGILYMISAHTVAVAAGQPYYFDATLATAMGGYKFGAIVARADDHGFWINRLSGNTNDPDAPGSIAPASGWFPGFQIGVTPIALTNVNVTLTPDQYGKPVIHFTGALTGNVQITFPDITDEWIVINDCTNSFTVTAAGVSSGAIIIPQGGPSNATSLFAIGDGGIYSNSISTAGLAPLASPHLTGVPTSTTAALHTNTTQIATTAFVFAEIAADLATYAPLTSPAFAGLPSAPTPPPGNNTTRLATTAFVQAALGVGGSVGNPGFIKFGNGLIVQWGFTAGAPAGNVPFTVTFPTPFPTACFGAQLTSSPNNGTVRIVSLANPNMSISCGTAGDVVYWLAYGN